MTTINAMILAAAASLALISLLIVLLIRNETTV